MENSPPGPSSPSSSSFSYITRRQRRSPAAAASQPQPRDGSPSRQRLRTESDTSSTAEIELDSLPNPAQDDPTSDSSPSDSESDEEALMLGPASFRGLSEDPDGAIELKSKRRSTRASKRKSSARRTSSSSTPGSDPVEKEPDGEDPLAIIRQVVPETDDPDLPSLTWRALVIGTVFCVIGAAISQLFFYKSNSPSFSSYFVILVTLPLGKWLARRLPDRRIGIGRLSFELNPGPFSIKEHLLVAVLSSSGAASAYASDIINIQELFFHQHMSNTAALTLLLTTQILGFGFAGLVHDLLVKPPAMIFPSTLVTTSLFHTLHNDKSAENRPKLRVFTLVFLAIFAYQFLPALFAPTLSSIAVLCLVNNKNKAFRVLSSGYHGLGFLNFTLDWNAAGTSGPFYQPWWAALNFYGGIAGMMYIVTPIYYFGFNLWESQSFPQVLGSGLYDKDFKAFKVDDVLLPDNTLDREKWQAAKPMLLTPFFAISYGLSFAILTSVVTHVLLWHWKDIRKAIFNPVHEDVHNRMMQVYDPVPRSWYFLTFSVSTTAACILMISSPSLQLPVWGLLLAIGMSLIFLVPIGILKAVSDTSVGLNVITEFVAGYLIPGNPIGNVCWKCYGYMSCAQALDLATDLKLGHYLKIPPKHMFLAQLLGTAIGCVVNLIVVRVVLDPRSGYRDFLDGTKVDPSGQWDGRKVQIFRSASVIWGLIGPSEFFSGQYKVLYWGFLLGLVLPLIPFFIHRIVVKRKGGRAPAATTTTTAWSKVAFPIILHGASAPPQVPTNIIMTGFGLAWFSQSYLRRNHPRFFEKFNYVIAAALDAGSSINALVIFLLSLTILKIKPVPNWAWNPKTDSEYCKVS